MASSHREHGHDKAVLSCLVGVHGVNWIEDKTRLSATENFETVLSYCDVIWKLTSSQMSSRRRQDKKQFCLVRVRGVN